VPYWDVLDFLGGKLGGDFDKWRRFTEVLGVRWQWLLTDEGDETLAAPPQEAAPPPPTRSRRAAKAGPSPPKQARAGRR